MAGEAERRAKRLQQARLVAVWAGAIAAGLVALGAVLLVLADTGPGRQAITRLAAAYAPANGLQIRIGRIEGSIYGRMTLRDLELRDPEGTFLTSPSLTVDWRPTALLRNHLSLREASSDLIRVLRRPEFRPGPPRPDQPLLPGIDITIERLDIRQVVLEPPVAGRLHIASLGGAVDVARGRARLDLQAEARPHDGVGGGDRLMVRLDAVPDADRLMLDMQLLAPVGGVVDGMANLGRPLEANISGNGTWTAWDGAAVAGLGSESLANLTLSARNGTFGIQGQARPSLLIGEAGGRLLQPEVQLDLAASARDRELDARLRMRSQSLDISGRGVLDLARSRFGDFRVDANLLQPQALLDDVRGRDVLLSVLLDGPFATPAVDYQFTAAALGFGDTLVEQLRAQGRFTVSTERTIAPIQATAVRVTGVDEVVGGILRNLRMDGDIAITPEQIASDNIRIRSDGLNATLVFAASFATGAYDAALRGEINRYEAPGIGVFNLQTDARLVPAPNGQFRLRGSVRLQSERIDNAAVADLLGGQATATAAFDRSPDGVFSFSNLRLASPRLNVLDGQGRYSPDGSLSLSASGQSEQYGPIALEVEGSATRPLVRIRAPSPNLAVPLTEIELTLRPENGDYLVTATGASPYGPLDAEALLRLGDGPLAVDVRRATLAGLVLSGRLQQTAGGPFAGTLDLRGSGFRGAVVLSAAAQVQQIRLDLQAENARIPLAEPVLIAGGSVEASAILYPDAPVATGAWTLSGVRQGQVTITETAGTLDYRGENGRLQFTASGDSGVPFSLAADVNLSPTLVRIDARGTANRIPLRLEAPAELRRVGTGWQLQPATIVMPQGRVQIAGATGDPTSLTARLQAVDLSIVQAFSPDLRLGGTATGTVVFNLPSNGGFPTGRAQLSIDRFTRTGLLTAPEPVDVVFVGELSPSAASANAVIRRRSVVIGRLQAQLTPIPASGSWIDRLLAAPLGGGLRYNGPSEVLWALTGMVGQQVSGPVAVGADFSGRLGQPRTEGVVRGRGLRYENQAYGTVITNVNVDGHLNGSRLELTSLTGRAGGGTVAGSGYINLAADEGFPMDIRLQLNRADLAQSDDLAAELTGEIVIANSAAEGARIEGRVSIDEARYRIARLAEAEVVELTGVRRRGAPLQQPGANSTEAGLPSIWRLDLLVQGDNRIFVTGMGLEAEWQAALRVSGTLDRPSLRGEIRAIRGTYAFAGRRLELTRGIILFDGEAPPNPRLDIRASTTVQGVTATIDIGGRAANPLIAFTSTPALPQDEVLARLLFGSSVTELSATQALQLASSLNTLRGGGGLNPLASLRQATGIDRLRFQTAEGGGASLAAGKYITNDVYVEVTTDARGFTAIQLEIALTRSLSLLSQLGSFGGTNLNLRYSRDY